MSAPTARRRLRPGALPALPAATTLGLTLALAIAGCTGLGDGLRSHEPPVGSESARRLEPGPYEVESEDFRFVDESRPTMENGSFPGAPSRTIAATAWWPEDAPGLRPLVVYAHGFTGNRRELLYLLEHLAGHGYVVASLDFPLTTGKAPGGPTPRDIAAQPGDVRFLIDQLLGGEAEPVASRIDPARIALAGLSYGGLTTTLASFHPTERDPRLVAAVSIAGPSEMFDARFFAGEGPSFLMVAGTLDGLVPFTLNAEPLPAKRPGAGLVGLEGGTHLGFTHFAGRWMRFSHNPDAMACSHIQEQAQSGEMDDPFAPEAGPDPFAPLGGAEQGVDFEAWTLPCMGDYDEPVRAMRPQRQHHLTVLSIRAFLDSQLGEAPALRDAADRYLSQVLPLELRDADFVRERASSLAR